MLLLEHWKPVYQFEQLYQVSNTGRVWSNKGGKVMKTRVNEWGYEGVILSKDNRKKHKAVHVMVYEAFTCPRPPGMEVNHKDGVKVWNRLSNLEWLTPLENKLHAIRNGINPMTTAFKRTVPDEVVENIRTLLATEKPKALASRFAVSEAYVYKIKKGKR